MKFFELNVVYVQIVVIFILMFILNRLFFKPISKVLKDRQDHIENAKKMQKDRESGVGELVKKHDASLKAARQKAMADKEKIRQEGLDKERELLAVERGAHNKAVAAVKQKAKEELEKAQEKINSHAKELSRAVAEKILQRSI